MSKKNKTEIPHEVLNDEIKSQKSSTPPPPPHLHQTNTPFELKLLQGGAASREAPLGA